MRWPPAIVQCRALEKATVESVIPASRMYRVARNKEPSCPCRSAVVFYIDITCLMLGRIFWRAFDTRVQRLRRNRRQRKFPCQRFRFIASPRPARYYGIKLANRIKLRSLPSREYGTPLSNQFA